MRGTSSGATLALDTITAGVPDLVELLEAGSVDTIGVTPSHPSNHWGTPEMVARLNELADAFAAETAVSQGRRLQINDLSLELGGKFDLDTTGHGQAFYNAERGHSEHREGKSADLRTVALTTGQRRFVELWWKRKYAKKNSIKIHEPPDPPHYHLRVP